MQDSDKYESFNSADKAAWWRGAMMRLDKALGRDKAIKIMQACGEKCCGETYRKLAIQYWQESRNLKEFIDKLNSYIYKGQVFGIGGGRLKIKDEHTIIGGYDKCYCSQVKHTKEPFTNDIYCHCSASWLKSFFESALEKPVNVEMIQTIINGTDTCEFIIHF
jgi:predicted hydrocarbon binding protein